MIHPGTHLPLRILFTLFLYLISLPLQASVTPVVLETRFKIGSWQPLPEEKIKQAAVDSALQEISQSRRFAFFKNASRHSSSGHLRITIDLIEAAEIARVSISLDLPGKESLYSTHSESLKNLYYDGIYKKFQRAGKLSGQKLVRILNQKIPEDNRASLSQRDSTRIDYLSKQIINLNSKIINLSDQNKSSRTEAELKRILAEIQSINSLYKNLASKQDMQKQDKKLDRVIDEVSQINSKLENTPGNRITVNQNYTLQNPLSGQTAIPAGNTPGSDEKRAQTLYNSAQELKRSQQYNAARNTLQQAISLDISAELRSLILDELNYALPVFEAQALAIDLGRNFQAWQQTGKDRQISDRITQLYQQVLKNNQHDFQRTRQIQAMLDQHLNTRNAMDAVVSSQNRAYLAMLRRRIQQSYMMQGKYPDKQAFVDMIKRSGLNFQVLAYHADKENFTARLKAADGSITSLNNREW